MQFFHLLVKENTDIYHACEEYRLAYIAAHNAISTYVASIGGEAWRLDLNGTISAVRFTKKPEFLNLRNVPKGWSAQSPKTGMSTVLKKSTEISKQVEALPKPPNPWSIYNQFNIPTNASFSHVHGSRSTALLRNFNPPVEWVVIDDKLHFLLEVADVKAYVDQAVEDFGNPVFDDDLDKWELPESLEKISKARYEYMWAKMRLQAEES